MERFLEHELDRLLCYDSEFHCGVGFNSSGRMHHRNPPYLILALAALINPETDVYSFRGEDGRTEYLVNSF